MGGEKRYEYTIANSQSPPVTVTERDDPLTVIVKVPLYQAGVVAVAVAVILILVSVLIASRLYPLPWEVVLIIPVIVGLLAGVGMFLAISWRRLLPIFERRYGIDLDRDGVIGEPLPQTVRLEITSRGGTRTSLWETGVSLETARRFATAALRGDTSVRAMDAARVSRDDCEKIRQALFDYGWARWRGGYSNQGWELTEDGADVMRAVQSAKASPPLPYQKETGA